MTSARMRRPVLAVFGLFATVFFVCALASQAMAYFTVTGTGTGAASATTLSAPSIATVSAAGSSVSVSWSSVTAPGGGAVTGYLVTKSVGAATFPACGTSLSVPAQLLSASTLSCTDTLVPNGTYRYNVVAVFNTWTRSSAPSTAITVVGDITAPLQTVSLGVNPNVAYLTGTTLFLRTAVASAITLVDNVTDAGVGPASATFPAITTTGFTHAAETVTTGTGTAPTKVYTSSPISWTAGATAPTSYTVTGRDLNNNATSTTLTVYVDNAAPTGGALTVNGVAATAAGSTSTARAAFTIGVHTAYTEAATAPNPASGFAVNNLVVQSAPLLANQCGAVYSTPTVISGTTNITPVTGTCYRYTLTGTDNAGNSSVLTTTVKYDSTTPSNAVTANAMTNAYFTANRVYVRTSAAGSFTLNTAVTDVASGPASVTYPVVALTGWTHAAETVTTSTGVAPTLNFASSTYSWVAGASRPSSTTITSRDNAGNATNTAIALTRDNTAPRSGSLTVNALGATAAGTTSFAHVTTLTPTGANYVDTASGLASSTLTYAYASLSANVCGTYGASVTASFATPLPNLVTGCYRFALTGVDHVGNTATISTVVKNDLETPTGGAFVINGTSAAAVAPVITTKTNTVTISGQTNFVDPASGLTATSNTITTATAPLTNNVCGTFGTAGTLVTTGLSSNCYRYVLTGTDLAGNTSSVSLIVKVDVTAPTGGAMTVNGGAANAAGSITTFNNSGTVAITARTDYTDANSGLASSVVSISRAPLTNNTCGTYTPLSTIATGIATQTYTQSACYLYSLVGTDNAGNVSTISTTVKVDLAAPSGGALSVNGVAASAAGSSSGANAAFAIVRTDYTDAETAITSSLTVQSTTFTGGACGTAYGTATTLTGSPTQTGLAVGCYRYTLTGTDSAGNTASISTVVRYDATAPTGGALTVNGVAASAAGSTSTSNAASFAITRTDYTDANSGLASSVLTVASAPLTGATCGTFGAATTLAGAPTQSGLATACYRYTLTGTDVSGNSVSLTTTVTQGARIVAVTMTNGTGTSGRIDQGDKIVITYSDQMSVASLCSTWVGDTADQSLTGSNQVTATLVNGTTSDSLTFASSACTLRVASLSLGSTAYTSANVNFAGAGAAATTVSWNATTHQLTITLGAASATGAAAVASSAVTATPTAGVTTSSGVVLGGTFVSANQLWF